MKTEIKTTELPLIFQVFTVNKNNPYEPYISGGTGRRVILKQHAALPIQAGKYLPPCVEVLEVAVEAGFAGTQVGGGAIDGGDIGGEGDTGGIGGWD